MLCGSAPIAVGARIYTSLHSSSKKSSGGTCMAPPSHKICRHEQAARACEQRQDRCHPLAACQQTCARTHRRRFPMCCPCTPATCCSIGYNLARTIHPELGPVLISMVWGEATLVGDELSLSNTSCAASSYGGRQHAQHGAPALSMTHYTPPHPNPPHLHAQGPAHLHPHPTHNSPLTPTSTPLNRWRCWAMSRRRRRRRC